MRTAVQGLILALSVALTACGSSNDSGGSGGSGGKGGTGGKAGSGGKGGSSGSGGAAQGGSGGSAQGGSGGSAQGGSGGSAQGGSGGGSGGTTATSIQTVFIILMENHDWSSIKGSSSAPYINSLLATGAHCENYHNVPSSSLHPSEPNYIWLEAGDNLGFTDDSEPGAGNCATGEDHLVKQLKAAGIEWKSYQEDIAAGSCPLNSTGNYAPKHNPMIFFDDVSGASCSDAQAPECLAHVVPYSNLAADLASGSVGRYNFLTPNQCNDMHSDCGTGDQIKQGDDWLSVEIPKLMASNTYKNGGAIFITWDEGGSGNKPIGMIVLSPLAKPGFSDDTTAYSHSSTLRTMQTIFGVSPFLHDAANATDLGGLFSSFP